MKKLVVVFSLLISNWIYAQPADAIVEYINNYKDLAILEMQRTGVPASIKLAQGIHETYAGQSELVTKSRNHFGIKCKATWTGDKVYHDDDARGECFRSYASSTDSYQDHSNFLKGSPRYSFLFDLDPTDYKGWAYGLKKAGYATNVKYSQIIIRLIEEYSLQQYSLIALGKLSPADEIMAGNGTRVTQVSSPVRETPKVIGEPAPAPAKNFPRGEFFINNTRVIYAKAGSSLLALAEEHDVLLGRLLDFNDIDRNTDFLKKDQLIFLQRKRKVGEHEFHTVLKGETLYNISQEEGIRLQNLAEYNHLKPHMVPAPGEKLSLRSQASSRPVLADEIIAINEAKPPVQQTRTSDIAYTHTVQAKETLYSISKKFGVDVEKIRDWNKIQGYDLKIGQELVFYKY